jgi:geranylgeranyl pyrophosphate synthase
MNVAKIISNLEIHLNQVSPNHNFKEVYEYGVLPPGKVFRPQLVCAAYKDFSKNETFLNESSHRTNLLASAVELHHAYTLLHDDLPCMDDDDERRGKPSTHKKFNQWKALLAGDGLQTASFRLISKYDGEMLQTMFKFFSWALGPKGLIQGQVLDLNEEMTTSFENLLLTHQNKTARLIQTSILLGYWSAMDDDETDSSNIYNESKQLFRFGHSIGIIFQLLDDLTELVDIKLSAHEQSVNPWINSFAPKCYDTLIKELENISKILTLKPMPETNKVLSNYLKKIESMIVTDRETIQSHTKNELMPIISLLQSINT